ncbi:uncharacterized protein A1O5_12027 [Cladophialophora psammophila CBS 110553]|uniref:Protein kinase domain-containing protein n=1 Tax=Cladophialophora psammophila CBS 110553 TaxID=1182543 RepID=W9W8B3_9EURO|nr:uncharacterized protein A1O5_12027 [Cladophialophora psammophila CBS 110553]EXJ61235.1 hypothetical protein A1O5_12027 [Cladophialophora psammophila CBS 110553]
MPIAIRTVASKVRSYCSAQANNRKKIEEETLPNYNSSVFYPARIGEVLAPKYRVVDKLGFGAKSTV